MSLAGLIGADKSDEAIAAQQGAAGQASASLLGAYNDVKQNEAPWQQAGVQALGQMQDPRFQHSFTLQDFMQDPGYQFRMQQGQQAIDRAAAARGSLNSGATLKDLTNYSQGMAAQDYQQAYNNYNNNMNMQFGRLGTLAGYGQNANSQLNSAAENYGNGLAGIYTGMGNAEAAADIASGNANAAMFGGILNAGTQVATAGISKGWFKGSGATPSSGEVTAGPVAGQSYGSMLMNNPSYQSNNYGALFCDERLKTDIEPVSKKDLDELKRCVKAFKFKYKDAKYGEGDFIGPMAQDLEKCKLGKNLITVDREGNKTIDVSRVLMLFLASMAEA